MRRVAVVALATGVAYAEPEARRELQAGIDAYRLGHYADARAHLEKAQKLDGKSAAPARYLAAVAQAEQHWQDCVDLARAALTIDPGGAEGAETRKLHDACRASAGRAPYRTPLGDKAAIAVTANVTGATVKVNGLTYGGTPMEPHPVPPGTVTVDVVKLGYKPGHSEVVALPGIVTDVELELAAEPEVAPGARDVPPRATGPRPVQPPSGCCGGAPDPGAATALLIVCATLRRQRRRARSKRF